MKPNNKKHSGQRGLSKKHSKLLSLVLRHDPSVVGMTLDPQGWLSVPALLSRLQARDRAWSHAGLVQLVADNDKQRFELSADGTRIRARQGHSLSVDLELTPTAPPVVLYHGTVQRFVDSILVQGLRKGSRQHVHLSGDRETAKRVGSRRGKPVLLTVRAQDLAQAGCPFYLSSNGVWLTDHVPPAFISG